ncbi:serine carboxypeptidase-like 33 [Perilla frutescens var. frutescens]|nr:serine carboxypeptidase-like 33 [Perilla frutescens var. frutescens]
MAQWKRPGCSSIGYGAAVELGPLRVDGKGAILEFNQNSWNKEANMLFLESPIGVGFPYTNTSSDFSKIDDKFVAEDAYNFIVKWLEKFPQLKDHEFFISGESYAGHYVPRLAEVVFSRNKNRHEYPYINLKGFIVRLLEYAWSHSVVSDQEYSKAKQACDFKLENWSSGCNSAMTVVFDQYNEIDIYNIYAPSWLLNKTSSFTSVISSETDSSNTKAYFNRKDVQNTLHINSGGLADGVKWKVCKTYNYNVFSILPTYTKLFKRGLKIWIYSGDADGKVPVYRLALLHGCSPTPCKDTLDSLVLRLSGSR